MTSTGRIRSWPIRVGSIALVLATAGCSNSGRALPPAGPNQTQSIVTTTVPSTTTAAVGADEGATGTTGEQSDGEATEAVDGSVTIPALTTATDPPADTASTDPSPTASTTASTTASSSDNTDGPLPSAAGPLTITAPWANGDEIPAEFTCKGAGTSPALSWTNVLPTSSQVAIVLTDPDAADFVHWVIWGIPANVGSLPAALAATTYLQAKNGFGAVGYGAPCPPTGSHTYVLTLYELNDPLPLPAGSAAADVIAQLDQEDINSVTVTGQATR